MTNGQPPRRPPPPQSTPPAHRAQASLADVRPGSERVAPRQGTAAQARPSATGAPPVRRRTSTLRAAVITIAVGLVVLAVGALALVVLSPPVDVLRERAVAAVKQATGRDLIVRGGASLSMLPRLGLELREVNLSAPPGMSGPPTVTVGSLQVGLRLSSLLGGNLEIEQIVVRRPHFDLRVDPQGRRSWTMAAADAPGPIRYADARAAGGSLLDGLPGVARSLGQGQGGRDLTAALRNVRLGEVRIEQGSLDYTDARSGEAHALRSIDMTLAATDISAPVKLAGDLDWRGETVRLAGTLTTLADVLVGRPAKVDAKVDARPIAASYTGSADIAGLIALDGKIEARSPSLRALSAWGGNPLPAGEGLGAARFAGLLRASGPEVLLSGAKLAVDDIEATGSVRVDRSGRRPLITADLSASAVNLDRYRHLLAAAPPTGNAPAPDSARPPQSIEELIEQQQPGPRVKGYSARKGWSGDRIDLGALDVADVDAKLALAGLQIERIKVGAAQIALRVKDRSATAVIQRVALYQGQGSGEIILDARAREPAISVRIDADKVAAGPLLRDAAGIDWLDGTGRLTLAVASTGESEQQIISRLGGRMALALRDGSIGGIDLGAIIADLRDGRIPSLKTQPSDRTAFSSLDATFDIVDGIASNRDLSIKSPLVRVGGEGQVLLPQRQLDYMLRPKVVASLEGQGAASAIDGLEIPVRITGDWERPTFAPDLSKIDLNQATRAVEKVLKSKETGKFVDDLFGKDSDDARKAKKFLEKLFR